METKICLQCEQLYKGRGLKFCSNSCKTRWRNLHDNVSKHPEVRAKMSASAKAGNRQAQLMTPEARKKAIPKIAAALKGRPIKESHRQAIIKGMQGKDCRPKHRNPLKGPNHPFWKGGTSTIRNQAFNSPEYKEYRKTVLDRDNWTCRVCNKRGGKLEVHHVKPWGPYPELRYDPANGITLCHPCHKDAHRGVPRPVTVGLRTLADLLKDSP